MTENFENREQLLPGLEEPRFPETPLEAAARRTIRRRQELGLLGEEDALICQFILDMAGATAEGRRAKRASAAAMAGAQLLAGMDRLPKSPEEGIDDAVKRLVEELRAAGRAAHVRDQEEPEPVE